MLFFTYSPRKLAIALFTLLFTAAVIWCLLCTFLPCGDGSVSADISFPAGSGVKTLAENLEKDGLIRSSWHFILLTRLSGHAHSLKAGEYRFNNAMLPDDIMQKIVNGEVDYRRFVLPEGYSIFQAAEILEQKGYFKSVDFLAKCRDKELLGRLGISGTTVEGYLFPATYNLARNENEEQLITNMVAQFRKVYAAILEQHKEPPGFSEEKIITVASMVEKEAVAAAEKPLIASVFYNRLQIGMPLQSDPTAVYGVRAFAGKVSKADIEGDSPYNTYHLKSLPPGPIGNPGSDAIKAALAPAKTDYLYFVAKQDGTHKFSKTLAEHNSAVDFYLKHIR